MTVSEKAMSQFNALPQDINASDIHSSLQRRHHLSRSLTGNFTSSRSMLYSPTDVTSSMANLKTRNSFDIMPRVDKPIPSLPDYHARPVFVKNTYANISSRPSKFIKPAAQHQNIAGKSPTDLDNVAKLFLRYNHKMYIEGYLTTMVEVTPEGRQLESTRWKNVFAELSGSTLAVWDAEKSNRQEGILPSYVNITDATMEILDQSIVGKPNCFAIQNTAGGNRFVFQARTRQDMDKWESGFWLASFEGTKLHEMYTRKILGRSMYKPFFTKQPSNGIECYLQVRFAGKSDWKRLWTVVDKKSDKKRWVRNKSSSPLPGQILLYDDKKSRNPVISVTNIVRAYAIYPETPHLSEHSTLFKVEGSITTVSSNITSDIPDRISHVLFMANNSKEMAQWLMSTFDIFKLYGRPQQMSFNQVQADGIHYSAESLLMIPGKLFLDIQEVQDKGLCDKKRWDQKGVFTDELQRKLNFEGLEPEQPASPKRYHAKSKSLQPSQIAHLKSKDTSATSFNSDRVSNSIPTQASSTKQDVVSIAPKQIGDSSEDDTEDDLVGETDEDTDDGSSLRIQLNEGVTSEPLASPTPHHIEPRRLTRQSSTSSSFLLDFGNLSGSKNMSSRASSATTSTSSLFGDFARSTELSKYIDPSVLEEDVNARSLEESHDGTTRSAASKEPKTNPLSFPKPNIRGLFPKLHWGSSGAIDYDNADDYESLSDPLKDNKDIEDLGGREGPPIPSLGDQFASENSLLAKKPADLPMTAQEHTEYARAMRQPLLHVPVKPKNPSAGLIGRITQLEYMRQQNNEIRGGERGEKVHAFSAEVEKGRYFERERDRQVMEHRQQQMLQHVRNLFIKMPKFNFILLILFRR